MRKQASVFLRFVRGLYYKQLILYTVLALLSIGCVAWEATHGGVLFHKAVEESWAFPIWRFAYLATLILLWNNGAENGSRQEYTLKRLGIPYQMVFVWQAIYNCICLFTMWAVFAVGMFGAGLIFYRIVPMDAMEHNLFLSFYMSRYLHNLLPLHDGIRWGRNILMTLCVGITAAHFPVQRRHRKFSYSAIVAAFCMMLAMGYGLIGNEGVTYDLILSGCALLAAISALCGGLGKEEERDEV